MAAATASLLQREPPMPLKPTLLFEEYTTIRIEYTHHPPIAGGGAAPAPITRKCDVIFCPDSSDKERLLRVINEYIDACDDHLLHIHDNDRYINFAQVIGGSLKMTWTEIITITNRTDANFPTDIRHFTRRFLPSNATQLQKDYLNDPKTTKPRDFDCFETRSRLELLNRLSQYLPGSAGNSLYPDALSQMNAYFKLMLDPWQLKWTENGNSTDQPDMTMSRLVDFMEQQRLFHNARQLQSRTRHTTPQRQSTYYNRNPPNNRYDNPYFSPNRGGARRPYRGGGGGRSPGGRAPMFSPGYSPPPGAGRPFNRGGGNHRGGGRGPPAGRPAGGRGRFPHQYNLRQRRPQRQLQFYHQDGYQMDQHQDIPPEPYSPHLDTPSNHGLYADDYSEPSQHTQSTFSYEDQHHLDNHHHSLDHYYNQSESPENYYPNYQDYDC